MNPVLRRTQITCLTTPRRRLPARLPGASARRRHPAASLRARPPRPITSMITSPMSTITWTTSPWTALLRPRRGGGAAGRPRHRHRPSAAAAGPRPRRPPGAAAAPLPHRHLSESCGHRPPRPAFRPHRYSAGCHLPRRRAPVPSPPCLRRAPSARRRRHRSSPSPGPPPSRRSNLHRPPKSSRAVPRPTRGCRPRPSSPPALPPPRRRRTRPPQRNPCPRSNPAAAAHHPRSPSAPLLPSASTARRRRPARTRTRTTAAEWPLTRRPRAVRAAGKTRTQFTHIYKTRMLHTLLKLCIKRKP
jgi:hypothetical protein